MRVEGAWCDFFKEMGVKGLDLIKDGWFMEKGEMWPGVATSLEVKEVLFNGTSDFQDVLVFKSAKHGNVLVLDGVIQCTQHDEFSYQEMIAHVPLFAHGNAKSVLVIGGGDGGVVREVLKHTCVEEVVLCEIDKMVIDVSRKFLPWMASSLDDARVTVNVDDGQAFLLKHEERFDVIITDSSDPVGPAATLFEEKFFSSMKASLRSGGVLCTQGESMWLHTELIKNLVGLCRKLFPVAEYAYASVPTYPSGMIGFIVCSKDGKKVVKEGSREVDCEMQKTLRYYNSGVHRAAFELPQFVRLALM